MGLLKPLLQLLEKEGYYMLDMQDIGYMLFMEEQERKEKEREEQLKVNVKSNYDLDGEQPTKDEK